MMQTLPKNLLPVPLWEWPLESHHKQTTICLLLLRGDRDLQEVFITYDWQEGIPFYLFIIPYISFLELVDLNSRLSRALIIYTSFMLYAHKATGTHI